MVSSCFGTSVRIIVRHDSTTKAERAIQSAFAELDRIESIMSVYRPDSQLSTLNRQGRVASPDPMFVDLLRQSQQFSVATGSAFDVTVQSLWELYQASAKNGNLPDDRAIRAAKRRIGFRNVILRDDAIELTNGAKVTLNGIAQGFATDRARRVLLDHGIAHALLDIGELAGVGKQSADNSWNAGIQHPRIKDAYSAVVAIDHRALATSGDYQTAFTDDLRCHHIFDPRTGRSPVQLASVSVLAPTATEADAMSTALMVMGMEEGARLVAARPGIDAMFIDKDSHTFVTSGFPRGVS
jgi:thiamine biosynthesis lipoprotein